MTRCLAASDLAMAYSATTVLPADVWAETRTLWLLSMHRIAWRWKGSSTKGYSLAGTPLNGCKGMYSWSGWTATSWVHDSGDSNRWVTMRVRKASRAAESSRSGLGSGSSSSSSSFASSSIVSLSLPLLSCFSRFVGSSSSISPWPSAFGAFASCFSIAWRLLAFFTSLASPLSCVGFASLLNAGGGACRLSGATSSKQSNSSSMSMP